MFSLKICTVLAFNGKHNNMLALCQYNVTGEMSFLKPLLGTGAIYDHAC